MRCPWYEKTMRKLEVDLLSKWCTACMFNVRKIKMTWFWKYTNEMPRLNLGLESRENVTSSLTKVDWKSKLVELPASWPSQRRSLHHCELAELLREQKINRRRKISKTIGCCAAKMCSPNEMCGYHCRFVVRLHILSRRCLEASLQNRLGKQEEMCFLFLSLRPPQLENPHLQC